MYFNSIDYFVLLPICYFGIVYLKNSKFLLFACCLAFYLFAGPVDTALICSMIVANWMLYQAVENRRLRIILAIAVNLLPLAFFKYRSFGGGDTGYIDLAIPLGISFYSFQMLSFQFDLKSAKTEHKTPFMDFALFVGFFPQLVAGPIVRGYQLLPQMQRFLSGHLARKRLIVFGLIVFLLGLVKKVVFADSLAPYVDGIFSFPVLDSGTAWLGAYLFTFQIYFDFSGYSDMAIGAAYLLGFRLPVNFRTPYVGASPQEFWRRWHITLSTWIRDYFYIPLGGSKGTMLRQVLLMVFIMGVSGLWHGANYTFICWGALWGGYAVLSRLYAQKNRSYRYLFWLPHIVIVIVLWVFFRSPDLKYATNFISTMFIWREAMDVPYAITAWTVIGCAGLMVLHFAEFRFVQKANVMVLRRFNKPVFWGLCCGLALFLILKPSYGENPFIYFRF
jgi:alginate O-acetyltransferase complex protein AlgI